jgi:hypothetical protein
LLVILRSRFGSRFEILSTGGGKPWSRQDTTHLYLYIGKANRQENYIQKEQQNRVMGSGKNQYLKSQI